MNKYFKNVRQNWWMKWRKNKTNLAIMWNYVNEMYSTENWNLFADVT